MKLIKFGIINKDKNITIWTQPFNDTVENIIISKKENDKWIGGKFDFITISDTIEGKYSEQDLNSKNFDYLLKN